MVGAPRGTNAFEPGPVLRSPHIQSLLASSRIRRWVSRVRSGRLDPGASEQILDCGDGVRLQGFHSPQPETARHRGLVVLLHGWEGCHRSSYLLSAALQLHSAGYEVFRLNFRDHGETHHLNEGLFHSCRLQEVVGAIRAIATRFATRPLFLVGFSLGGNFALRVALRGPGNGLPLRRIVAVCPVIEPAKTLQAMESGSIYQRYFVMLWRRSLRRKQKLFPERYDLTDWMRFSTLREQTRYLVERYAGFDSLEAYLDGYAIGGSRLAALKIPASIITAADDPIIPVDDFAKLERAGGTELEIQRHGGHCGFIESLNMRCWVDRRIVSILETVEEPSLPEAMEGGS